MPSASILSILPIIHRHSGNVLVAAAMVAAIAIVAGATPAEAECEQNYYQCELNHEGRIDPANPGCCWSPLAGPPDSGQTCPANFYKCDLNRNGVIDPAHPGCCLQISDVRVKRDIAKLATLFNGVGLYRFRYIWSDQVYVGVMAQEVQKHMPEAVQRGADGYLRVNYEKVDAPFKTWEAWTSATEAEHAAMVARAAN